MSYTKVIKHLQGQHNQHDHGGGSGSATVESAKKKYSERATKLGYSNISYTEGKDGNLNIMSNGKKTKHIITPEGRILSLYKGKPTSEMTDWGWRNVKSL